MLRDRREPRRAVTRVVAADRDEHANAEPVETLEAALEELMALGGVRARDSEVRSAAEMDAARIRDGERSDATRVALHQPTEAVLNPEYLDARERRSNRGGADDAVDSWRGSAADEDCELLVLVRRRGHG